MGVRDWFARFGRRGASALRRPSASYAAGRTDRLVQDWFPALLSADLEIKSNLRLLRARSRQLWRDHGHFSAFGEILQENVVGWEADGIRLWARNELAGGFAVDLNRHLETQFQRWGEAPTASVDGHDSFGDLQRLYVSLLAMDGEVLWRLLPGFDNPFGFAVQFLDIDQLDETYNVPAEGGRHQVVMGVELDAWNRPVAYHIWKAHPSEPRGRIRERIPADQVCHDFVRFRPGQTRGVPWATPVMLASKMLDGYTEAEIVQSRLAASAGGFFEMTGEDAQFLGTPDKPDQDDESAASQYLTLDAAPGLSRQLPPGLKFAPWEPQHPNGNYAAFHKAVTKLIAAGLNVSYATLTGDLTEVNYSSMRAGMLRERDGYRTLQRYVAANLNGKVYRTWLRTASLRGAIELPTPDPGAWSAHQWQFRGWPWVDPLNDIQAAEREIRLGLTSRTRLCAERGLRFEDVAKELAEEQRFADELEVDIAGSEGPAAPRHDAAPPASPDTPDQATPPPTPARRRAMRLMAGSRS